MVTARVRVPAPVRVVFDGQSHNGTPSSKPMPVWLMHGLGIPWANVSLGGVGWSEFTDTETRLFPQARNREGCTDILVMNGGQGDILDVGMTGAQAYAAAVDYADAARAAGFSTILATTPPAMGPNMLGAGRPTSGEQTALDGLRTLLLANGDGAFDAVVDLRVPPLDDATDTDFFQYDRLHVTEAGAEAMADLIRPSLVDLIDPPVEPPTLTTKFGSNVVGETFPGLYDFESDCGSGYQTEMVRIYGGGGNSTSLASRSRNARTHPTQPGLGLSVPVFLSCRFAEDPATTDATLISYLSTVQGIAEDYAAEGTEFFMSLNPEPDRTDRTYSHAEFRTMHGRITTLAATHAPDLTWVLNLTGYQFTSRIGNYWPYLEGEFDVIATDPYWVGGDSRGDVETAHEWAHDNGLRFGIAEWGVERGKDDAPYGNQGAWAAAVVEFFRGLTDPVCEFAAYFEFDNAALGPDGYRDEYGAAVMS